MDYTILIEKAIEARKNAYTPYFKFPVGAAILTQEGKIFTGCNIENAAGTSICAERTALVKAISEGYKNISAVAIVTDLKNYGVPCGFCRQTLVEFGGNIDIVCAKNLNEYKVYKLKELLPDYFGPDSL